MVSKKAKTVHWDELMEQVQDMPAGERKKPLADRVAEAEELLAHPERWGAPIKVQMGRPRKGEAREEVENMSFRAPRALKQAFAAAAETQGIAPSEALRRLVAAYVETMAPKPRRTAATKSARKSTKARPKPTIRRPAKA